MTHTFYICKNDKNEVQPTHEEIKCHKCHCYSYKSNTPYTSLIHLLTLLNIPDTFLYI